MKYLCLVYADENVVHSVPDEECVGYDAAIREGGACPGGRRRGTRVYTRAGFS